MLGESNKYLTNVHTDQEVLVTNNSPTEAIKSRLFEVSKGNIVCIIEVAKDTYLFDYK